MNSRNTIIVIEDYHGHLETAFTVLRANNFQSELNAVPDGDKKRFSLYNDNTEVVFLPSYQIAKTALEDGIPNVTDVFLDWELNSGEGNNGVALFPLIYNRNVRPAIYLTSSNPEEMKTSIHTNHGIGTAIPQAPPMSSYLNGGSMDMVNVGRAIASPPPEPKIHIDGVKVIEKEYCLICEKIVALSEASAGNNVSPQSAAPNI